MRYARPLVLLRRLHHAVCARSSAGKAIAIPHEVHALLKRRGMDLFTLTDHDSIEGAEKLRREPNFFLSEELTCRMPSGTEVHIGVYDFHERQHAQLLQRRNDLVALLMYLTERRIFFSINHVFSSVTGRRETRRLRVVPGVFPGDRNAQQPHARRPRMATPRASPSSGTRSPSAEATRMRSHPWERLTPKFPARAIKTNFSRG